MEIILDRLKIADQVACQIQYMLFELMSDIFSFRMINHVSRKNISCDYQEHLLCSKHRRTDFNM